MPGPWPLTLVNNDVDDVDLPNKYFFSSPEMRFDKPIILNDDFFNLGLSVTERTLEKIMPLFNDHPEGLIVERDGVDIGVVTPRVVVNALATAGDAS